MIARDRLLRDQDIRLEASGGASQAEIAERHSVCTRTVRRVLRQAPIRAEEAVAGWAVFEARWTQLDAAIESLGLRRLEQPGSDLAIEAALAQAKIMVLQMEMLKTAGFLEPGSVGQESGHFHA